MTSNNDARVILAVANEADDHFVWEQLKVLQAEMFAVGPLAVKVAYFGAEAPGQTSRPFISTRWATDADDLCDLIDRARVRCVCGCFVQIIDILAGALKETKDGPVQAVVIVGNQFRCDLDDAVGYAQRLCAAGTRLFLLQQTNADQHSTHADDVACRLAEQTGGGIFRFNPAVERVAQRLPSLLEAVTHFAIGGTQALEALDNDSAALLLEQMNATDAIVRG